jgi:ABC-type bacteriocin/lantibiotic exporter with double-glycine peptidase domain
VNKFSIIFILLLTISIVIIDTYKLSLFQSIMYLFSSNEKLNFKNKIISFFFIEICLIFLNKKNDHLIEETSNKVQIQLMNLIYKNLLLNNINKEISEGNIINLIQSNANAFHDFLSLCNNIIIIPISLSYNFYYLYQSFRLCFIPSVIIIGFFSFYLNIKEKETIKKEYNLYLIKDSYLQLITQTFNSIKNIKLLLYEKFIYGKVIEKKNKEIDIINEISDYYILKDLFLNFANIIMSFITIITYNILYKKIDNSLMINSFYSFNYITGIIISLPKIITGSFNIFIPFKRIEQFIKENKTKKTNNYKQIFNEEDKRSVIINNMDFGIIQDSKKINLLLNINIKVNKGEFIGVLGNISSGKSNFLKSLINNLEIFPKNKKDKLLINGKISYVSQIPFLINDTIRNNILFYNEMDYEKYDQILSLCELKEDINLMEKKDFTIIKEKGNNLSSGQKSRINIARALYNNSDIYLFDDPLNFLDNIIANKIFKNVFLNYLKGKTIIFVTHHVEFIKKMNRVIFFIKVLFNLT